MKENEKILILDFGGQYNQLIARRVRECNVYSEVVPFNISLEKIKEIETTSCNYFTKYKSNYIYKCKLTYKEIGETLIPLGEVKTKDIYAVLIPYKNNTFTYKVYNSSSEDKIWEKDSDLK